MVKADGNVSSHYVSSIVTSFQNGSLTWTSGDKAIIFAAFYIGLSLSLEKRKKKLAGGLVSTIVCSPLSTHFGPSLLVLVGSLINVAGSGLSPSVAVQLGAYPMAVLRLLMGFGQASSIAEEPCCRACCGPA